MHEVLVNHLEGLSLPRKSVVRLTDRPDMTLDVYRGRKTTKQQQQQQQYTLTLRRQEMTVLLIFILPAVLFTRICAFCCLSSVTEKTEVSTSFFCKFYKVLSCITQ